MKISVITPRFTVAGVPLAQIRFARALEERGHQVDLVIGHVDPEFEFPELSSIRVHDLNCRKVRHMLPLLCRYLTTHRPEVVFSAEDHLNCFVLLAAMLVRSKAKISCSSRVTPFDTYSNRWFSKRWFLKQMARLVSCRAEVLTCVSRDMVEQYRQVFAGSRHTCVYNIVKDSRSLQRLEEPINNPWFEDRTVPMITAAGSLYPWKGFADLIEAVALLRDRVRVRLAILGTGPLREELTHQIERLGLQDVVQLMGYQSNPLKFFSRSEIFCLSSHVEGLPNVLVEAMMCGCTPVSTNCPTGPAEVLCEGKYGYLVPMKNPAALADGIERALANPISKSFLAEAVEPFEAERVIERHFTLLGLTDFKQETGAAGASFGN